MNLLLPLTTDDRHHRDPSVKLGRRATHALPKTPAPKNQPQASQVHPRVHSQVIVMATLALFALPYSVLAAMPQDTENPTIINGEVPKRGLTERGLTEKQLNFFVISLFQIMMKLLQKSQKI